MTGRTILIVEDHTMIAEYIASVVVAAGFEPIQARSLAEARARLAERRVDLWLCDRNLPDGDSIELLAERDRDTRHRGTPAIALTAELTRTDRQTLVAAGFADALAKPCSPHELRAAIEAALTAGVSMPDRTAANAVSLAMPADIPVLDDEPALTVCGGDHATLSAMRRLMAGEIPGLRERFGTLLQAENHRAVGSELHQLAAAAAWCGAAELAARAATLRSALDRNGAASIQVAAHELDEALARLSSALRGDR